MYLFNKQEQLINVKGEHDFTEIHLVEKINTASQLTFSVVNPIAQNIQKVCVPAPRGAGFLMFKIITEDIKNDHIEYTCVESAYDELASYGYIRDLRPSSRSAEYILKEVLKETRWRLGTVYNTNNVSTNFYYEPILNCIQDVVSLFDLELTFTVAITGNKIVKRQVNMYTQQGERTGKRFEYGSNALEVEQETSTDELYTALVGRGKGEEVEGDHSDGSPTGYGRRITFADVVWKKSNGDALDKPKGQEYLEDLEATKLYGFADGSPRIGIVTFEDDTDKRLLLNHTYEKLLELERPQVRFKASVLDVGDLGLGDTVTIIRHDFHIEYFTRVFKVDHDLLDKNNNTIELGDDLSGNDIGSQVNDISNSISSMHQQISYVMAGASSDNQKVTYSPDQPADGSLGDLWYKDLGNGQTEMYIYNDGWQLVVDSSGTNQEVLDAVEQAKSDAKDAKDKADNAFNKADQAVKDVGGITDDVSKAKSDSTNALSNAKTALNNASSAIADAKNAKETASGLSSKVDSINGQMVNKADKSEVNAIDKTVKQQGTLVEQNAEAIKKTAKQSDVNTLTGRVKNVESSSEQNAKEIKQKVTSSDVQSLLDKGGYATQKWTGSQINQKADEISHTVTEVSNKVDNLDVNNRNLAVWDKWQRWGDLAGQTYISTTTQSIELACDNTKNYEGIRFMVDLKPATKYVMSFDATLKKGVLQGIGGHTGAFSSASVYIDEKKTDSIWSNGTNTLYKVGDKHHYEVHFISKDDPNNDAHTPGFFIQPNRGNDSKNDQVTVLFENIMIQEGDKATGYTPAPEDLATVTALSKVDQKVDSYSVTIANKADKSETKQLADKLQTKITKKDVQNMVHADNLVIDPTEKSSTLISGIMNFVAYDLSSVLSNGTKYGVSFDIVGKSNTKVDLVTIDGSNQSSSYKTINVSKSRQHIKYEGTKWQAGANHMAFFDTGAKTSNFTVSNIQVNKGGVQDASKMLAPYSAFTQTVDMLNLRVAKGDIINQINISTEGILIDGAKTHITGKTSIDNAVIKSAMIDKISANKITTGTLNAANVNIINMNVNKLVGNTTSFVQSAWNGISDYVTINSGGIDVGAGNAIVSLKSNGMHIYSDYNGEDVGLIAGNNIRGYPSVNGLNFELNPSAEYMAWSERRNYTGDYSVKMLYMKEPQAGYAKGFNFYANTKFNYDVTFNGKIATTNSSKLYIDDVRNAANGNHYAGLMNEARTEGFLTGVGGGLYLLFNNTIYSLKGVKLPTGISNDGTVARYINIV